MRETKHTLPILSVEDLQIEFRDHSLPETAVHDFDLTLHAGEIVGIVGESGAGKSLSALAIAGLLKRHSAAKAGRILFDDLDLLNCPREVLREYQGDEIAVIFQEPMSSLDPLMRIGPQVEESLRIREHPRRLPLLHDPAVPHHDDAAAQLPHQAQVMGNEEDRRVLRAVDLL